MSNQCYLVTAYFKSGGVKEEVIMSEKSEDEVFVERFLALREEVRHLEIETVSVGQGKT